MNSNETALNSITAASCMATSKSKAAEALKKLMGDDIDAKGQRCLSDGLIINVARRQWHSIAFLRQWLPYVYLSTCSFKATLSAMCPTYFIFSLIGVIRMLSV